MPNTSAGADFPAGGRSPESFGAAVVSSLLRERREKERGIFFDKLLFPFSKKAEDGTKDQISVHYSKTIFIFPRNKNIYHLKIN